MANSTNSTEPKYYSIQHKRTKEALELVHRVQKLLTPSRYFQWGFAVDSKGFSVGALDRSAHRWSLLGLLAKFSSDESNDYRIVISEICKELHPFGKLVHSTPVTQIQAIRLWANDRGDLETVRGVVKRVQTRLLKSLNESPVVKEVKDSLSKLYIVQVRTNPNNRYSNFKTFQEFSSPEEATECAKILVLHNGGKQNVRIKVETWIDVKKLAKEEYLK